jgi:CheY-like chemotaxis protein
VEDEKPLLKLAMAILEKHGYTVLGTGQPVAALALAKAHAGRIDLLLTDVVMPQMNGRELKEQVEALHPGIKCLYVSGYTADAIAHRGVLDEGTSYLQKPFTVNGLTAKVRQVLDGQ